LKAFTTIYSLSTLPPTHVVQLGLEGGLWKLNLSADREVWYFWVSSPERAVSSCWSR